MSNRNIQGLVKQDLFSLGALSGWTKFRSWSEMSWVRTAQWLVILILPTDIWGIKEVGHFWAVAGHVKVIDSIDHRFRTHPWQRSRWESLKSLMFEATLASPGSLLCVTVPPWTGTGTIGGSKGSKCYLEALLTQDISMLFLRDLQNAVGDWKPHNCRSFSAISLAHFLGEITEITSCQNGH